MGGMPDLNKICNLNSDISCNLYMKIVVEEEETSYMNGTKHKISIAQP